MKLLLDIVMIFYPTYDMLPFFSLEILPPKVATVYLVSTPHGGGSLLFCSGFNFAQNNKHCSAKETQCTAMSHLNLSGFP